MSLTWVNSNLLVSKGFNEGIFQNYFMFIIEVLNWALHIGILYFEFDKEDFPFLQQISLNKFSRLKDINNTSMEVAVNSDNYYSMDSTANLSTSSVSK